ncbi:MAG: TonB-dependent receptor, partial [Myxococcota bacterium]
SGEPKVRPPETGCAPIRGRVVDADLGTAVPDALIASNEAEEVALTDADGQFAIGVRCSDSIAVTVSKAGFASSRIVVKQPQSSALTVRLGFAMQSVTIQAPLADPLSELGFINTLDGAGLAETRGLSLGDALSRLEGVQVLRAGAVNKPVIDGFYGNRILILNDGLRHHAQLWALDHAPEIDPFSASRLSVVRGAEGVRYGADAIGGAILIEPAPFIDPTSPGIVGEANLVGISNGRQGIANIGLAGTIPGLPRWSVRAQGSVKKSGSLDAPDYPLDNTAAEDVSGSGAVRYLGRGWQVALSASYVSSEYGIFTGIRSESIRDFENAISLSEPVAVELYQFSYDIERAFSRVSHTYVRADSDIDIGDWGNLQLTYGYQQNSRREFDIVRQATSNAQLRFQLDSHALEASLSHRIGEHIVGLVGVSGLFQLNDHEGRRLIPDYDRRVGGIFALERYRGENFEVAAGIRYERQGFDTTQPARIAANKNPPERFSLDFEALMASIQMSFDPDPAWRFDVHLATATRIPTIDELFLDGLVPGEVFIIKGDRELEPEQTINLGLGIAFAQSWLDAKATAYVHRIGNYIYRAPALDDDGQLAFRLLITGRHPALEYQNVDALYAGGTVSLNLRPLSWVELQSRATYVRARDLSNDRFLIGIPPDRYENKLIFKLADYVGLDDMTIWLQSVVVRRQTESDPNADFAPPPPAYHLMDAGLATAFSVAGQRVRLSIEVQNMLNTSYRDYLSRLRFFADEPGFSAVLRLGLPFELGYGAERDGNAAPQDS